MLSELLQSEHCCHHCDCSSFGPSLRASLLQDFLLDLRHDLPWLLVAMLLTALLTAELCKLFGARAAVKVTLAPS